MFVCCNGKIILFTEINNSKKGLSHFLDSPLSFAYLKDSFIYLNKKYYIIFLTIKNIPCPII